MPSSSDAPGGARRRTPIFGAFLEGWRRVWRAPAVAAGVLLTTMLLALPLGMVMKDAIELHLGSSLQADRAAEGWNAGWAAEFGAQAQGVARTFTQEFLGFGGTLSILSDLADREPMNTAIAWAVVASIVVWMFLWGGIMDRLA